MTARLVSLAAGTLGEFDPVTVIEAAAAAGFAACGVWFDPDTWTDRTAAGVRSALNATGTIALDIEPIMLRPDDRDDAGERIIDAAIAIGARHVLVASRDPDRRRVAARLAALADRSLGTELRIVLEFLPVLAIRSLDDALAITAEVDDRRVGVLIDSLHLARSGAGPIDVAATHSDRFFYLQICDAPLTPASPAIADLLDEALHGRLLPGEGALPLIELLAVVPEVPLSAEIRSRTLRVQSPDAIDRARRVRASLNSFAG